MKQFEERVQVVRDCLRDKLEEVHKVNSEKQEGKRLRTFEVGDNVLLRKEGLSDKLSQAWKGPFKITNKVGPVNYELDIGSIGKRKHRKIVHINNIKEVDLQEVSIHRVVLADD